MALVTALSLFFGKISLPLFCCVTNSVLVEDRRQSARLVFMQEATVEDEGDRASKKTAPSSACVVIRGCSLILPVLNRDYAYPPPL